MSSLVVRAGGYGEKRFLEFFAAQNGNRNTREAYLRAMRDFLDWAEEEAQIGDLLDIEPVHVAAWGELKTRSYEAKPEQRVVCWKTPDLWQDARAH